MLGGAVVPHGNGVGLPVQAHLILQQRGLAQQVVHQVLLLSMNFIGRAEAVEVRGEVGKVGDEGLVYIKDLLAAFRVRAHNGVNHGRVFGAGRQLFLRRHARAERGQDVMHGKQLGNLLLARFGQLFVSLFHIDPDRVATDFGAFHAAQNRSHGRRLAPGHIGVIDVLGAGDLAVAAQQHQLMVVRMVREHRVQLQIAKAARKGHMLGRCDVLVTEDQHLVRDQGLAQLGVLLGRHGLTQVYA